MTLSKDALRSWCDNHEIPLLGIADAGRWHDPAIIPDIPLPFRPDSIFSGTQSVIVIGLPVHLPSLESSPSVQYSELYRTINTLLDQYTYRIAERLNQEGHPSIAIPRDGYGGIQALLKNPVTFFSHRHAAHRAGLGTFGLNNMLLTPAYGPRARFGSVLTTLAIEPDPLPGDQLCTRCMECVEQCPVRAVNSAGYPEGKTNSIACAKYSAALAKKQISPCGICIKVCPIGRDRAFYDREDVSIYRKDAPDTPLKRSWEHVRSYGSL
ncbi:MAG: epoxyqueuosine reductase [Methanocalculus sp. MSAO_Arc1]|uniref:epoxyqueuosine reductase n=1 Tax=Methanocalculus TaxID=71151 RepID=UPI000FEDF6FC|nr:MULTISPECIES: epoxyqueuosine reductase [unclassified Methanocalculus]MCP1661387.1 epoxyqueuosine reductase QueG [Methanocalculus sp. AMF5]RQD79946.1 MAG: epoxyqueuosine reductase [Methanocalculus sp. MSAO_Arc1]